MTEGEWWQSAVPDDGGSPAPKIDVSVAHPARVYDYWLGGKNNYAADREAAEATLQVNPYILPGVRANRAFLVSTVRYLAQEAGIRQFLDIGTGLPTENNTHEVAQSVAPESRVVYVDNDPIVLAHARALLTGTPGTTAYIDADLRDPGKVLSEAVGMLHFGEPVAIMLPADRAFLVQFRAGPAGGPARQPAGRIEHLDSGRAARFSDWAALRAFIEHTLSQQP